MASGDGFEGRAPSASLNAFRKLGKVCLSDLDGVLPFGVAIPSSFSKNAESFDSLLLSGWLSRDVQAS
jgi:hypothetical protein